MKITEKKLQQLIQEEIKRIIAEANYGEDNPIDVDMDEASYKMMRKTPRDQPGAESERAIEQEMFSQHQPPAEERLFDHIANLRDRVFKLEDMAQIFDRDQKAMARGLKKYLELEGEIASGEQELKRRQAAKAKKEQELKRRQAAKAKKPPTSGKVQKLHPKYDPKTFDTEPKKSKPTRGGRRAKGRGGRKKLHPKYDSNTFK